MFQAEPACPPMLFRSSLALGLVLFAAPLASAQGGLTATPNPYDNSSSTSLVLRNGTAAPVTLDSLRAVTTESPETYRGSVGFVFQLYVGSEFSNGVVQCYASFILLGPCQNSDLFGRTLAPSDSVVISGFGRFCDVCRPGGGENFTDTLRVYSGGSAVPLNVEVLNVMPVASEVGPRGTDLSLALAPNPGRNASTLTLSLSDAGTVRVAAYDALGREVAVLHDGPASEALTLRVDTSGWPVGLYVVRASAGERASSSRLVVAR